MIESSHLKLPRILPFVKATACGNDFLLVDASELSGSQAAPDFPGLTRCLCDRHEGVGADGVEWMSAHASADVAVRLFNVDGSEAEISGNGTRCVAAYVCEQRDKEKVTVLTAAGLKGCTLTARREGEYEFETQMGAAQLEGEIAVKTAGGEVRGIPVSLGNPHFVVFVSQFPLNWQERAAEIQGNHRFKRGVNVEMVIVDNKYDVSVRFFERGVGETRSSGTGSCASAVAAIAAGKAESPVRVHAPGGTQIVRVEGEQVFLRGAARLVCRGEFFL